MTSSKDWPEDAVIDPENGTYYNTCLRCHQVFTGHKYRRVCRECEPGAPAAPKSVEQMAREMLLRAGVDQAESMTAGDLVEIANLISANMRRTEPTVQSNCNSPETAIQIPPLGSCWRHTSGRFYRVLHIANINGSGGRYPVTVVYQSILDDSVWSRLASEWERSMTRVPIRGESPAAKEPQ